MARKNVYMVFDTETTTHEHIAYDVGYVIADKHGRITDYYQAVVEEVITSPEAMRGAFYHRKVYEKYIPMLSTGETSVQTWQTIFSRMEQAMEEHRVSVVASYNLAFDARVMRTMQSAFGTGGNLLRPDTKTLCLWNLACMTKLNSNRFRNTAEAFGWKSEKGNYQTSAEVAYRYLAHDPDFIEEHTALSDAIVETKIMAECFKAKKAIPYDAPNGQPWKLVQREANK
jgi:hypothetical protein